MLDVFNSDAYSVLSLTTSINMLPFKPSRLGALGLFGKGRGISETSATFEMKHGKLSLIQSQPRGIMPQTNNSEKRVVRALSIPHLPLNDVVMADEVQGKRVFGSEDETETVTQKVTDKMMRLRQNHEVTHEYHRAGAIQGIVLDADGSVMYDLFDFFGVTETEIEIDFTSPSLDLKLISQQVHRALEDALGNDTFTTVRAFCGNQFWDSFISHSTVKGAFEKWQVGTSGRPFSITTQREGFDFCEIVWENYRGKVGGTNFIPTGTCRFVIDGATDLFDVIYAPAPFVETVNTIGKLLYAKQETLRFGTGVELHTQSNPLHICTRPKTLIKGVGVFV